MHVQCREQDLLCPGLKYFKETNDCLSPTCILNKTTYCCFLGFKYLTGLLKVTPLFNALTLHRARFELLQERVRPLLDFQDLVCIFIAVKYWDQKCESTSREQSWLKTGNGPFPKEAYQSNSPSLAPQDSLP